MGKTIKSIFSDNVQDVDLSGIVRLLTYATVEVKRRSLPETADLISLSISSLREEVQRAQGGGDEENDFGRPKPKP